MTKELKDAKVNDKIRLRSPEGKEWATGTVTDIIPVDGCNKVVVDATWDDGSWWGPVWLYDSGQDDELYQVQFISNALTISLPDEEEEEPEKPQFVCPYCGYTCPYSELGGEFDCPWCGDN